MILTRRHEPRRGVVLVAVLIVVVVLSLAAYRYSDLMLSEARAAESSIRTIQARHLAESGVIYVVASLADTNNTTVSSNPYDNSSAFQDVLVPSSDQKAKPGRFSILSIRAPDDIASGSSAFRMGVIDEASKINLNTILALDNGQGNAAYNLLMALPNMTDDIANAIIDWLDPDDTARQNGAESETYSALSPAYRAKNGPLDSIEELLLVRGMTPQLLFGNDRNRNGTLDKGEDDGSGQVDQGWSAYLTVYSREPNLDSTGNARVYINDQDLNNLTSNLNTALGSTDLVNFIVAYRMYGGSTVSNTGGAKAATSSGNLAAATAQINTDRSNATSSGRKLNNIQSLWDLVNAQVTVTIGSGRNATTQVVPSPLNDLGMQKQLLPLLLDKCTTSQKTDLPARININTAPVTVIQAIQAAVNLSDTDYQSIIAKRPDPTAGTPDQIYNTTAWLMTEASVSQATMKKLDPYITARTQVYRFQSIGYFEGGGPTARVEAVVDTNQGRPRIVYYRPLTELGNAFDVGTFRGQSK
jgi:type II secretory pathway component PulK